VHDYGEGESSGALRHPLCQRSMPSGMPSGIEHHGTHYAQKHQR
jgi:hypothetical protein